jgi:protein-tyrosine phosphatase
MSVSIDNILGFLWLGNRIAAENLDNKLGWTCITAVVNVTEDVPNFFEDSLLYLNCPLRDTVESADQMYKYLDVAADWIEAQRQQDQIILVHCKGGISRSPTIVLGYMIKYKKMKLKDAIYHVKRHRSFIKPNEGYMKILLKFEKKYIK